MIYGWVWHIVRGGQFGNMRGGGGGAIPFFDKVRYFVSPLAEKDFFPLSEPEILNFQIHKIIF